MRLVVGTEPGRVSVYTADPGPANTALGRHQTGPTGWLERLFYWPWLPSPQSAAQDRVSTNTRATSLSLCVVLLTALQTVLHCCVSAELAGQTGRYYRACRPAPPAPLVQSEAAAAELWRQTERVLGTA